MSIEPVIKNDCDNCRHAKCYARNVPCVECQQIPNGPRDTPYGPVYFTNWEPVLSDSIRRGDEALNRLAMQTENYFPATMLA
jgi:hypothetical protein